MLQIKFKLFVMINPIHQKLDKKVIRNCIIKYKSPVTILIPMKSFLPLFSNRSRRTSNLASRETCSKAFPITLKFFFLIILF